MSSQSYDALWKKYSEAQRLDQPKTQAEVLDNIISLAEREKQYGHLLKAYLNRVEAITAVTPDSLNSEVSKLVEKEKIYAQKDPLLVAVWQSVLGSVYKSNPSLDEKAESIGNDYYKRSLSNPDLLAAAQTSGWTPLLELDTDSKYFGNDLLSVLAFQADEFERLYEYYDSHGRREAACLAACYMLREKANDGVRKAAGSDYLRQVEDMIGRFGDLDVAGELALVKYEFLESASDVDAAGQIRWIEEATQKWPKWNRLNQLKNSKLALTQPMFSLSFGSKIVLPGHERVVKFDRLRNLKSLTMRVSRVNLDPKKIYRLTNSKDLETVRKAIVAGSTQSFTRQLEAHPDYKFFSDSITLPPLQRGIYLAEFDTNEKNIETARTLFYVSDVFLLTQPMPSGQLRLAAVSATTGKPLKKASLLIKSYRKDTLIVFGSSGDTMVKLPEGNSSSADYYLYTPDDNFCPSQSMWMRTYSYSSVSDRVSTQLFTDRSIYRPGQTVHVALLHFGVKAGIDAKAIEGKKITMTLMDANSKEVGKQEVTTDSFGKASADFMLPQSGLTGSYRIEALGHSVSFRVEEYKRPTFEVEMPVVKEAYKDGDTLTVKGYARTYSGVPVQGAKVSYSVVRSMASWWWGSRGNDNEETLLTDTVVTDDEGAFTMRVPIVLPRNVDPDDPEGWERRFYKIDVDASVTDLGGETHTGMLSLPISRKLTAFNFDVSSIMEREKVKPVWFELVNGAGDEVDGEVTYTIDDDPQVYTAKTNVEVELPKVGPLSRSGKHVIKAVCQGDTVTREFVLFSYSDKKPCIETHNWFRASDTVFDNEGTPVTVQVGTSDPDQVVFYDVFAENRILEHGSFILDNSNQTRQWKYREEYGTGLLITYAWVREGVAYTHSHQIRRPLPDKSIDLKWETFRDRLTPGTEEVWTLRATYPDGSPADAQLMATIYDKSLDQLSSHYWWMNANIGVSLPSTSWTYLSYGGIGLHGQKAFKYFSVPSLDFTNFDHSLFRFWSANTVHHIAGLGAARGKALYSTADVQDGMAMPMAMEETMALRSNLSEDSEAMLDRLDDAKKVSEEAAGEAGYAQPQLRENLNETAAFIPQAATDADGRIMLRFTLPESVTTWNVKGIVSDRLINHGSISGEAIAKKDIMVVPNMPRFVRLGDKAQISARIFNTSDKTISGQARMELVEPETEKVVFTKQVPFSTDPSQTVAVTFDYLPEGNPGLLICKVMAMGDGFSDGEQHYLPVLSNMELITRTWPFTQVGPQQSVFELSKLFPDGVTDSKLTIEYTNNPAWLMLQALPTMAAGSSENAITQATSYYANALGQYLMNLTPNIRQTVMKWREETDSLGSLSSSLEKNEELKDLLLNETPWVPNADKESSQKRSLVKFFDEQTISFRLSAALDKLAELQNHDGSWSWWKGMDGSIYMTTAVSEMFIRLNKMIGKQEATASMLEKAYGFMGDFLIEEMKEIKKLQKKGYRNLLPSEAALSILYNMALDGRKLEGGVQTAADFLVGLFNNKNSEFTIFGKARGAVILSYFGKKARAAEYLTSIDQYSVATPEMGRYFDTRKAYYSWRSYKIPTQIAAIEAYKMLRPEKGDFIGQMRLWLLQQKRAQMWDTPINSVDAVYAFLEGNTSALDTGVASVISVDGVKVETSKETAGIGYVKTAMKAENKKKVEVEKTSQGTSWGALYAQFMQKTSEVENTTAGLSVVREVRSVNPVLRVGDRVTVRLTIKAERDLDFVEVIDRRAACMEPVSQLSGYHYGYYISPKDYTTNYYFDKMSKGTHIIETEYYIDRKGTYETGTCKAQCAYAPEFSATGKALQITVNE